MFFDKIPCTYFGKKSRINFSKGDLHQKFKNITIILIDAQACFLRAYNETKRLELIQNWVTVLMACSQYDIPAIILEHAGFENEIADKSIDHIIDISKKIPHCLTIRRNSDDGFRRPIPGCADLEKTLTAFQTKNLLIMGIHAHRCVLATSETAKYRNYQVISARPLIHDYDIGIRENKYLGDQFECDLHCSYASTGLFFEETGQILEFIKQLKSPS